MRVDYSPRQSGRTTRMVQQLFLNENAILLTFSEKEAERIKSELNHQDVFLPNPSMLENVCNRILFWKTFVNRKHGYKERQKIMLDNADYVLEQVLGTYIDDISITKDEIKLRK